MIANTPMPEDFFETGNELLAFSWDIVLKLLVELDNAEYFGIDQSEISEEYWNLSQRHLTTALAIMQQGIEFLIKGRICEISPFLLISDSPAKWPSPNRESPIEFSKFRTIDAQDLIKVHDTFSTAPFDDQFTTSFNELREKRNKIMHSVDKSLNIQFGEIIESLLFMHKSIFPNQSWATVRYESLEKSPNTELGSIDYITNELCKELSLVIALLPPSKVRDYFKIDKKKRGYFCPKCFYDSNRDGDDFTYKLARLASSEETCTTLYCPACDKNYEVVRTRCRNDPDCPGDVVSVTDETCLSCGS